MHKHNSILFHSLLAHNCHTSITNKVNPLNLNVLRSKCRLVLLLEAMNRGDVILCSYLLHLHVLTADSKVGGGGVV